MGPDPVLLLTFWTSGLMSMIQGKFHYMHSPDETVDEEDVAPQQLSLIKMSSKADSRDNMLNKCKKPE